MDDPGSLSNLRDIVTAPPVSWWPLAPGWWFVISLAIFAALVIAYQRWARWRRNAYRRAAIAELLNASDDAAVSEILKRAAISGYGRGVGSLAGERWCKWLSESAEEPIPIAVQERLASGVYHSGNKLTPEVLQYARQWITGHRVVQRDTEGQKRT